MYALKFKRWGHVCVETVKRAVSPSFFVYVNVNSRCIFRKKIG